jgi:hypothetical protein
MPKQIICPLCGTEGAEEWPISGQDVYEIICRDRCKKYQMTTAFNSDEVIKTLPKEDRLILSDFVSLQFQQTRKAVFLESADMAMSIIVKQRLAGARGLFIKPLTPVAMPRSGGTVIIPKKIPDGYSNKMISSPPEKKG